jgi:hypothetical protein
MANTYGKVSGTFEEIENAYGKCLALGKKRMRFTQNIWYLGTGICSF